LLAVAGIPTLISGIIGYLSLEELGDSLASETSELLLQDAELRLKELAVEYGQLIGLATSQLDMAVRIQQLAAKEALTSSPTTTNKIVSAEDFDNSLETIPNPVSLPMFECLLIDGSVKPCPVSYQTQAIIRPEGISTEIANKQSRQLQSMDSVYKAISIKPGDPAMRYFTATVEGMGGTFPGHGGLPSGYNPALREWFALAKQSSGQIMHTPPAIDASTGKVVVASVAPIFDDYGKFIGATGAERSVIDVLRAIHIPIEWRDGATMQVVVDQGNNLKVIASQEMTDGIVAWNESIETKTLSGDSKQFSLLVSEIASMNYGVIDIDNNGDTVIAAYAPIGGLNASLLIWVPHNVIAADAIAKENLVRNETQNHAIAVSLVATFILIVIILLALFLSKFVSKPIVELTNATELVAKGNFDVSVENCGSDEIGELTRHFNEMVPHLKERLALQESLEVAKHIQQCLLPSKNPVFSGWEITGKSMYCDATGGDYYDFISPHDDDSHLRLVLGDVTGHGIASALMMATARSLLRGGVQCGDDPVQRLCDVNNALVHDTPLGWFMTFFCLELKSDSSEVFWISAGHDPAIVVSEQGEVSELKGDDIPLGVTADWSFTGKGPTSIPSGSVVVLGTDGIWEARNVAGDMYGKERLVEVIVQNRTKSVVNICETISASVLAFCDNAPRTDDITMVVARRI
jgi:sigma-B regulation protein RsbU (phosphoserine phosphatase)